MSFFTHVYALVENEGQRRAEHFGRHMFYIEIFLPVILKDLEGYGVIECGG